MEVDETELLGDQAIEDVQYEMAMEYFEYNIKGAYVGEFTPIFIQTTL